GTHLLRTRRRHRHRAPPLRAGLQALQAVARAGRLRRRQRRRSRDREDARRAPGWPGLVRPQSRRRDDVLLHPGARNAPDERRNMTSAAAQLSSTHWTVVIIDDDADARTEVRRLLLSGSER